MTRLASRERNVQISKLTAAERLFLDACRNPPTTTEWIAYLRRIGDRSRFWHSSQYGWTRRRRPFISPYTAPLHSVTCQGYWWVRLP